MMLVTTNKISVLILSTLMIFNVSNGYTQSIVSQDSWGKLRGSNSLDKPARPKTSTPPKAKRKSTPPKALKKPAQPPVKKQPPKKAQTKPQPPAPVKSARSDLFDPSNPYYPITENYEFHNPKMGSEVVAIRLIECDGKETFSVLAFGKVIDTEDDNKKLVLKLKQNYSMINFFNASEFAWNFSVSSKSINSKTLWCEPIKEFCLKPIPFEKYGLAGKADTEFVFSRPQVFSLKHGIPLVYQAIVSKFCGKRPSPSSTCSGHIAYDRTCPAK